MDQISFDPRTGQWHDLANRYRMVRQSVVESIQKSNRVERNGQERYVENTVFDAFRRDVYRHISDTANLTKKAVESLRKSLQNEIADNRRLQQDINDTRENRQEQLQDRLSEETKRDNLSPRRERGNRSFLSSFLGISGLGFGAFAALSYFMTPEQITRFGERIDETLSFIPDIQSTINAVNEISETMRRVLAFFGITESPETSEASAATPQGGGSEHTPEPSTSNVTSEDRNRSRALGLPSTATEEQRNEVSMALGAEYGGAGRHGAGRQETPGQRIERAREARQTQQAAAEQYRIERAPERPEQVISQNLFNEEARQSIENIRNDTNLTDARRRELVVPMIQSSLMGGDRSQLANTIATQIGQHTELHGADEATRRMIMHSDPRRAAEMIYDTFYIREVSGRGRGGAATVAQRRIELQRRIQRVNTELQSGAETVSPQTRTEPATAITAAAVATGATGVHFAGVLPNINVPRARAPGTGQPSNPPGGGPPSIAARNQEQAMRSFAEIVRAGGGSIA